MRSKFLGGTAAVVLAACTLATSVDTASAAPWGWHRGFGWPGAVAAGVVGGAIAAATSPLWAPGYYDYYPGYTYAPAYGFAPGPVVANGGNTGWCEAHFRSYNPATGMYTGYDGLQHPCS
jgi:hypothetical protein